MVAMFAHMSETGCIVQDEKSNIWVAAATAMVGKWSAGGTTGQCSIPRQRLHTRQIPRIAIDGNCDNGENDLQARHCK